MTSKNSNNSSQENIEQTEKEIDQDKQKMNVNPNPRANENVKNTSFEKEPKETSVGSEITDGEGG